MKSRSTLLTFPHSPKGYGSKRAAKGKIYFDGEKLLKVRVDYGTSKLYPNAIDPEDVSIAEADDHFIIEGKRLVNYDYRETPSSPQFFLYSLASPENATMWHGVGAFGASQLVKSYATVRLACQRNRLIGNLEDYGSPIEIGPQFNLIPDHMWYNPIHRNIDASIGTIDNMEFLAKLGLRLEVLSSAVFIHE